MPPRIPLAALFESLSLQSTASASQGSRRCASTVAQKRRKHADPYLLAQSRARKAANLSRRAVLQEERAKELGDPVMGIDTPFLRSFDTGLPVNDPGQSLSPLDPPSTSSADTASPDAPSAGSPEHLNHFISAAGLRASLDASAALAAPIKGNPLLGRQDPAEEQKIAEAWETQSTTAREALRRIAAVENTNSKDRIRVNTQRCIETFGRHRTDQTLRPKPVARNTTKTIKEDAVDKVEGVEASAEGTESLGEGAEGSAEGARRIIERAGPDTGSSEVQIAILTAKIRTLAQNLDKNGRHDKMNKRNLRLLVHKRQKLLRYLRRKERGGERWQHLIQTLGLTEGTWRGEISL